MKIVVLDGVEYVLIPKSELLPDQPIEDTLQPPDAPERGSSPLDDFLPHPPTKSSIDDGLATQDEKENAITIQTPEQIVVAPKIPNVPKATPQKSSYREKYVKKELTPADVMTFPRYGRSHFTDNPEDPMIKTDANRPKGKQLFYGPGIESEGY